MSIVQSRVVCFKRNSLALVEIKFLLRWLGYILLGTPVFQEFPNLNRCPRARRINGRVKLLASRPIHKTNRVSTRTLENDRCKLGLNIYFTTKCTHWELPDASIRVRTTIGLTWLPLSTPDSKTKRSSAQQWRDTNLKGHDTVLYSVDAEIRKNQGSA